MTTDKLKVIKIPIVMECYIFNKDNVDIISTWLRGCSCIGDDNYIQVFTLDGMKTAHIGYYIVKNPNGSFEVFHPAIFKSIYNIL